VTSLYTLSHDFKVKTHIQQTINQPPSDSVTPTQTHMLSTKKYSRVFVTMYQTSWKISFKTCLCVSQTTSSYHLPCPSPKQKSTTFSECQNGATDEHTSWRDVTYSSIFRHPRAKRVNEFSMLSLDSVSTAGMGLRTACTRPRPVILEVKSNASDLRGQCQGQWSLRSRPRPVIFEVNAEASGL